MNSQGKHGYVSEFLGRHESPCLSLYQPTFRHFPENQQDPIRFKNLIKVLEESLLQKYRKSLVRDLLEPYRSLADRRDFWNHTLDGLAVLGGPGIFRVINLQRTVSERAIVADSFHIKPLLRSLQTTDRYQVLGLDRREMKLFEGTRHALDEIEPAPGVPRTIKEALGDELTEPHQTVASYGMGAGKTAMRHGHGGKKDELDKDVERFFRAIDRAVLEHHSKKSGLPLYLAALPEYHGLFHEVSHNPYLAAESIDIHPDAMERDAFRERVWRSVEPRHKARLAELVEDFGKARAGGLGTADPSEAAVAAVNARIGTLLIEDDRQIPGQIDETTGRVEFGDIDHPEVDDLLDDLGELVLKMGGRVLIVPPEKMPTNTGLAAIYRY